MGRNPLFLNLLKEQLKEKYKLNIDSQSGGFLQEEGRKGKGEEGCQDFIIFIF